MSELKLRLTEKIERTATVESFRFKSDKKIDFSPGQFLQVLFDESEKSNPELNKYLSISSSPTREYIEVTKRISDSEFSRRLLGLRVDEEVSFRIPLGNCVFEEKYKKLAFLIGGIGITPVISIIEYIFEKKLDTDVYLCYSNKRDSDIAFRRELDYWQSLNKNIKIRYTVTDCPSQDKSCIYGFIDKELLAGEIPDIKERVVFIFGPALMVDKMFKLSLELGGKKDNIKTERFIGY